MKYLKNLYKNQSIFVCQNSNKLKSNMKRFYNNKILKNKYTKRIINFLFYLTMNLLKNIKLTIWIEYMNDQNRKVTQLKEHLMMSKN